MSWTPSEIPDQAGKTYVITGANSGIGHHAAKHLVRKGAEVVLACRRLDAAEAAAERLSGEAGTATAAHLDLADLDSVAAFADRAPPSIDVLINNAGVMMVPFSTTPQGYESQWGINVVGHAALTKALLPRIEHRVVTISSLAHRDGRIDPGSWRSSSGYDPRAAYCQSKLGDLIFALELQRHLEETGSEVLSVAAHPGASRTRLAKDVVWSVLPRLLLYLPFTQSADEGSWPTLYAATTDVEGGSYWGPGGRKERRGPPAAAHISDRARKPEWRETVWDSLWR